MLYYNFNYDEFKTRFGIIHHDSGQKSRRNKILLAYIKQPHLLKAAIETGDYSQLNISNMTELQNTVMAQIITSAQNDSRLPYDVELLGYRFKSAQYALDIMAGVCEDGSVNSIRYIKKDQERVYKMKAGKMLKALIYETEYGKTLPEQVVLWLCEEFTQAWTTFTMGILPKNKLYVNKEFGRIYSWEDCAGSFCSCMTGRGLHSFYKNAVDASAAYLQNDEGKIIARCIIFNKVHDQDGKIWRLAERQYATDGNDILKRCLVEALLREGLIDGYKRVGADCHDNRNFVDIAGNPLNDREFWIDCKLDTDDVLSYQDSFVFFNEYEQVARNYASDGYDYMLDSTEGSIDGEDEDENYDSFHEEYTDDDLCTVYFHGEQYTCAEGWTDDFRYVSSLGELHYYEDVFECPYCHEYELNENAHHSDLIKMDFCSDDCLKAAEEEYMEKNPVQTTIEENTTTA